MGYRKVGRPIKAKMACWTDPALDHEATWRKLKGSAHPEGEPLPPVEVMVDDISNAWLDNPCDPTLLVPQAGQRLALFSFRALSPDEMIQARDMALQMCKSGPNWNSRFAYARNVAFFRLALIEARDLYPGETPSSFSVRGGGDDADLLGTIEQALDGLDPDVQNMCGRAYLRFVDEAAGDEGK